MAYLHARANVCRSGVTHAGLVNHPMGLTMGGVSRKGEALQNVKYVITVPLDGGPSTCSLRVQGTKPAVGQDLLITLGGEVWWGGSVLKVKASIRGPQLVYWDVEAIDWTWLLDRYLPVNAEYAGIGINTAVHQLLATFTNGGFHGGYLPSSLGDVGVVRFEDARVVECLQRLAKSANGGAGAYLRIRPDKSVDIATTFPDGVAPTWTNTSNYRDPTWEQILNQVRTRTYVRGRGTTLTATAPAGATTIAVDDCEPFAGVTGPTLAKLPLEDITYTGTSVGAGPGDLTGVSGLTRDAQPGAPIAVSVKVDDAAAQTALATVLGGGRSGVVSNVLSDAAWTLAEATQRANADVQFNKAAAQAIEYTVIAKSAVVRTHLPGAVVTASVTTPLTISGAFTIQSVTIVPFDTQAAADDPWLQARISAGTVTRANLADYLLKGK